MSDLFKKHLEKLDFRSDSKEDNSLLFVSNRFDATLGITEVFALEEAAEFKADAVYFRHFPDGRSPLPQIYLYDATQENIADSRLAEIHRDLWSSCRIPMFIEVGLTDISVYDTRKPVSVLKDGSIRTRPYDSIPLAAEAVKLFTKKQFDSGMFWENEKLKSHFLENSSAYKSLIDNLKYVKDEFSKKTALPNPTVNKLLVYSILIKYLEERGNEGESLFAKDFFRKELGAEDFCGVLRQKGQIIKLFVELRRHFNGKIFEWADGEEQWVENADLSELATLLDAKTDLNRAQPSFWRKYSFHHLPVELISTVYESFLSKRDDAVYTPAFLVNFLVDQAMPLNESDRLNVKTIDVSCGSGIFLVSAFRRLAQRQRFSKFKETKLLERLNSKEILRIIRDNIFGVDIEEDAVRLTVFSLCLAVCDELSPKEIWTELKFDETFQKNFRQKNFFEYLNEAEKGTFDLVIGNPPFEELGKKPKVYEEILSTSAEIREKAKKRIYPKKQIALMFLDQSPSLLKDDGVICLIMPAGPLLYNNSAEFRKDFFNTHQVSQIIDFTSLGAKLFPGVNVPTAVIFAKNKWDRPDDEDVRDPRILHLTVRRTKTSENRLFIEIDKYDFHYISYDSAISEKHVWKCNLLGGGRLRELVNYFSHLSTLGDLIRRKQWKSGEGYKVFSKTGEPTPADYITGHRTIPSAAFSAKGVDETKIRIESEEWFESPRDRQIYEPPLLIIQKNIRGDKIQTYFSERYLTYNESLFGISAPNSAEELKGIALSFEKYKLLYKTLIAATSNEFGVGRATSILKQDVINLPFPENEDELKLSEVEKIICDDVLQYRIGVKSSDTSSIAENSDLKEFGKIFCQGLNSVYEENKQSFFLRRISTWNQFYIAEFNYGQTKNDIEFEKISKPSEALKSLIQTEYGRNVYLIKVLKLYERNKVYFIKPKALRYWHKSIALRDADEVFADLVKAGY